ncbi:S41 family peptidase [Fulvivirga maritima]|uniref:S41 family peptidase n=1 Tax=Fulvivirga maritima TaxID=2904247 RepID=UPI001F2FAFAC|nr:S41 family peptidase [Fulvivirga maritima]UII26061.1 S41 family peptidase [Fulvivirga maritima]
MHNQGLTEWLKFFRDGHLAIRLINDKEKEKTASSQKEFDDWETYSVKEEKFKKYLRKNNQPDYEGIWEVESFRIGIKKEKDTYIGFIIESDTENWQKDQVKLKISESKNETKAVFYKADHSAVTSDTVTMMGNNHLQIGEVVLTRLYPEVEDQPQFVQYFKMLNAKEPYLEVLNKTTLYLRIPSFEAHYKNQIDSLLEVNKAKITSTKNLIIDIRDNGGGSDSSYDGIIPYLYTNPIRVVLPEFLSTKLNNQRMLDLINDPKYGLDEASKKWAKSMYDKLDKKLGEYVSLSDSTVSVDKMDSVYAYPANVGIIINEGNASTAEQFLGVLAHLCLLPSQGLAPGREFFIFWFDWFLVPVPIFPQI